MGKELKELNEEWDAWTRGHVNEHMSLLDRIVHWKEDEDYSDYNVVKREKQARSDMVAQFCQDTLGWTKEEATCFVNQVCA